MRLKPKPPLRTDREIADLVEANIDLAHIWKWKQAWKIGEGEALSVALDGLWWAARRWKPEEGYEFRACADQHIKWRFGQMFRDYMLPRRGRQIEHVPLDAPFVEGGVGTMGDRIPDEGAEDAAQIATEQSRYERLHRALRMLRKIDPRLETIVKCQFGIDSNDKTLKQLAKQFKIGYPRVRQLRDLAVQQLALILR